MELVSELKVFDLEEVERRGRLLTECCRTDVKG
jgi:hypothetical protein